MVENVSFAQKVLSKQLKDIQKNEDVQASIGLENDDDLFLWNVVFEGCPDTLYEGGFFKS
jgi:ubiquitin-conjugating enzyme E2 G1